MKKVFISVAICIALGLPSLAQQNPADAPATQADVEKYLEVTHAREMIDQMMDAMSKPMHKTVHDMYIKDQDKLPPDFEERMNRMMEDMLKNMPWDEMMQATVAVYQKHFTKGDIDALTAFYSSPVGQKMMREMPAIMADSMNSMMPIIQKYMQGVTQRMQQETEAMLKESQKTPRKAPSPAVKN
jgi:uncharacterized protein